MEDKKEKNVRVREDAKMSGITISRAPFDSFLSYFNLFPYALTSILGDDRKWLSIRWSVGLVHQKPLSYPILFYLIPPLPQRGAQRSES